MQIVTHLKGEKGDRGEAVAQKTETKERKGREKILNWRSFVFLDQMSLLGRPNIIWENLIDQTTKE